MPNEFKNDPPPDDPSLDVEVPPPEDEGLPPRWQPHHPVGLARIFGRILLLLVILLMLVILFTPYAGKLKRGVFELVEKARGSHDAPKTITITKEVIKEVPAPPPPLPSNFVPRKETDLATLFNGISIQTKLQTSEGTYATLEGKDPNAYTVEFQVKVRVPKANNSIPELARVNEHLPKMLPGLTDMMPSAKVSGFYHKLYETKVTQVERNITRLTKVLDKHNFFDTETILELQHPITKRIAMLLQSDMDVVADGSDGDRMSTMDSGIYNSDFYQPSTSYSWAKVGKTPNPLLSKWQARYDAVKKEYGTKGLSAARNAELKAEMQRLDAEIHGLKTRSSLIAEKDPFIVISLIFKDYPRVMAQAPAIGDYCAVIHGNKIFPAICGDYGPTMKMGEASLLIAKAINEKATPYIRGEDDLKVTYLIFPGTAEKPFGPPNLDKWHEKISTYLKELGGLGNGYTLHKWDAQFPKPQAPADADKLASGSDRNKNDAGEKSNPAKDNSAPTAGQDEVKTETKSDKPTDTPAEAPARSDSSKSKTAAAKKKKRVTN